MYKSERLTQLCALAGVLALVVGAFGDTITIPTDYATLQEAVNAASNGDTILLKPNTYSGSGFVDVVVRKLVTIQGGGDPNNPDFAAETVIDCEESGRALYMPLEDPNIYDPNYYDPNFFPDPNYPDPNEISCGDIVVRDLTIKRAAVFGYGGAVYCEPNLPVVSLINCRFLDNQTLYGLGGAAFGVCEVIDCFFYGNRAAHDGGAIAIVDASAFIDKCIFVGNGYSESGGGAIHVEGTDPNDYPTPLIRDCVFTRNRKVGGGALCSVSAAPTVEHCIFVGNWATGIGAAATIHGNAHVNPPHPPAMLDTCLFAGNQDSGVASAVDVWGNPAQYTLKVQHCTFLKNYHLTTTTFPNSAPLFFEWTTTPYVQSCLFWGNDYSDLDISYNWPCPNEPNCVGVADAVVEACHLRERGDPELRPGTSGTWTADAVFDANTGTSVLTDANAPWAEVPEAVGGLILILDANFPNMPHYLIKEASASTVTVWGEVTLRPEYETLAGIGYEIYDYHLSSSSPCRNPDPNDPVDDPNDPNYPGGYGPMPTPWSDHDLDGQDRDAIPDIGCDEYKQQCGRAPAPAALMTLLVLTAVSLARRRAS